MTRVALITGASQGLGAALARHLSDLGWTLIVDARRSTELVRFAASLPSPVTTISGDVSNAEHRSDLLDALEDAGRLDLLFNNASMLGPSPLPRLVDLDAGTLARIYAVNTIAPLQLFRGVRQFLAATNGVTINVSSDAAVESYEGWGGYGSSKAALDHISATLGAEHPELAIYALDPGDMRTDMHQAAFPGEDISDRPLPETVVPAILELFDRRPPSGRYRAADLLEPVST